MEHEPNNNNNSLLDSGDLLNKGAGSPISDETATSNIRGIAASQQQQTPSAGNWCTKPEMLPFLSLCSRYLSSTFYKYVIYLT